MRDVIRRYYPAVDPWAFQAGCIARVDGILDAQGPPVKPGAGELLEYFSARGGNGCRVYGGDGAGLGPTAGARYGLRDAVYLETQFFPDTPNHLEFPQCVLRPGELWEHETVFRFSRVAERCENGE